MMKTILALLLAILLLAPGAAWADTPFLTKGQNLKVMPVGDSITLGKNDNVGGYRRILYEWLTANGYAITYVGKQNLPTSKRYPSLVPADGSTLWHEGYGSIRTDQILNGGTVEKQTAPPIATSLQNYQPDIVLLMIGTNDILQKYQLDTLEQRLGQIVDAIYAFNPKTIVLVASIAPLGGWTRVAQEARAKTYNASIPPLVAKEQAQGHQIAFVDIHQAMDFKGALGGDQVHPTALGYAHMAQAWYKALTGQDAPAIIDPNNPLLLPPPLPMPPPAAPVTATTNAAAPVSSASTATTNTAPSAAVQ